MHITKNFKSGNSMAVRIPKNFHVPTGAVEILERDGEIIIRAIPKNLTSAYELLTSLPDDFFATGREDSLPQKREF